MKKLVLVFVAMIFTSFAMAQQKNCYLYSQKVFQSMTEYTGAVKSLEEFSVTARKKADLMLEEAKTMFEEYQKYQSQLTTAQRNRYKQQIMEKEKAANDYQESIFGDEGELAKRQKTLMEPIERKVMSVVEAFAKKNGYDMVFDLSLVKVSIYQNPKLDITDKIIEEVKNYNFK